MKEYNSAKSLLDNYKTANKTKIIKHIEDLFKSPRQLFLEKQQNIIAPEGWCRKYAKKEIAIKNIAKHHFSDHIFDRFRDDKEVVMAAIEQYPKDAIHYCSRTMQADREVVEFALSKCGSNLSEVCPTFQNTYSIALEAVKNSADMFYVSDRLKNDKGFMTEVINSRPGLLSDASDRLKNDTEFVFEAVKRHSDVIEFASDRLQKLCEGKDPVRALEGIILAENLMKDLSNKPNHNTQEKKLKI